MRFLENLLVLFGPAALGLILWWVTGSRWLAVAILLGGAALVGLVRGFVQGFIRGYVAARRLRDGDTHGPSPPV